MPASVARLIADLAGMVANSGTAMDRGREGRVGFMNDDQAANGASRCEECLDAAHAGTTEHRYQHLCLLAVLSRALIEVGADRGCARGMAGGCKCRCDLHRQR